ncbi:MAG: RluA family pseudouridine synthase [Candidatus Saccharimonadales bacterium]|jgi:23S rRNA pseudouridine1911/1915/1917 synthase
MRQLKVRVSDAGKRADIFVSEKYPEFSRSSLNKLFDSNTVRLGKATVKASHRLKNGEILSVDDRLLRARPRAINLPVIYEDKDVVVVDKPAGILTHSKGAMNDEATVASFLQPKITDNALSGNRAGIVHRLDRHTSGVIIGAKTNAALKHLQKQFTGRKTAKTYLAVVEGWPEPEAAIIDAPIGRNPRKPQTFKVSSSGRPAQTAYRTLKVFTKNGQKYAFLELKPATGRTHQIRVHLSYIGHPIVGDSLYGHAGPKLLLHAHKLEITLPNREHEVFEASVPDDLSEFIKNA